MKNLLIYSDLLKMDTESKIKEIKKWVDRIRDKYIDIPSESVDLVYDFLILNKPTEVEVPGIVAYYYGLYYDGDKNPEKLLKYYLIGVESGVAASMHNLGNYYRRIGDAANTEKYYKMAMVILYMNYSIITVVRKTILLLLNTVSHLLKGKFPIRMDI